MQNAMMHAEASQRERYFGRQNNSAMGSDSTGNQQPDSTLDNVNTVPMDEAQDQMEWEEAPQFVMLPTILWPTPPPRAEVPPLVNANSSIQHRPTAPSKGEQTDTTDLSGTPEQIEAAHILIRMRDDSWDRAAQQIPRDDHRAPPTPDSDVSSLTSLDALEDMGIEAPSDEEDENMSTINTFFFRKWPIRGSDKDSETTSSEPTPPSSSSPPSSNEDSECMTEPQEQEGRHMLPEFPYFQDRSWESNFERFQAAERELGEPKHAEMALAFDLRNLSVFLGGTKPYGEFYAFECDGRIFLWSTLARVGVKVLSQVCGQTKQDLLDLAAASPSCFFPGGAKEVWCKTIGYFDLFTEITPFRDELDNHPVGWLQGSRGLKKALTEFSQKARTRRGQMAVSFYTGSS